MKQMIAGVVAAGLVLAGHAMAGEGCGSHASAKTSTGGAKACKYDATASAGKSCGDLKAGDCRSCDQLNASGKALRATGANFEFVKTKAGYVILASATGADNIAALRKANHERWTTYVAHVSGKDKTCKSCAGLQAGLKRGDVNFEEVETANGVMTIFTASNDDACAALKASCGAYCGLKTAEANVEKTTATN